MQYVSKSLKEMMAKNKTSDKQKREEELRVKTESNFLKGITDPTEGIRKLEETCKQMPKGIR